MLAVLSPGQGSQSPGFLAPWLDSSHAKARMPGWSETARLDLVAAGTSWSSAQIRDTAVAQPLLTVAALLSGRALLKGNTPDVVCGHSVGELPALALAGVITDDEAVALAALRGRTMAAAAGRAATGMAAVLGGDPEAVTAATATLGLELATVNVAGQVVLGGPVVALRALAASPPVGARIRLLDVAGAFHTQAMTPAIPAFAEGLGALTPTDPRVRIVANADGAVVGSGRQALHRLLVQLTSPVRFDLCLAALTRLGTTRVVELAPGGTLAALAKRALAGTPVVALKTPDDLPAARALIAELAVPA
jgi:[acyl-carrier-protein] S-malonyltransferase